MLPQIEYYQVNWVDGMKVSKERFLEGERAMLDQLRDSYAIRLHNFNYGLLAKDNLKVDPGKNVLELSECRAVTPGGVRIEIDPLNSFPLTLTLSLDNLDTQTSQYDVVLVARFYERVPIGNPDPNESPLRLPFSRTDYRLELVPSSHQLNISPFQILLGKLEVEADKATLKPYIPACTSIAAHDELMDTFDTCLSKIHNIQYTGSAIVKKIYNKDRLKNERLASHLQYIIERVVFHIASIYRTTEQTGPYQAPVFLLNTVQTIGDVLLTGLNCIPDSIKDEVNDYCSYYAQLNRGAFKVEVESLVQLTPRHTDILNSMVEPSLVFLDIVEKLFEELDAMDDYDWNIVKKYYQIPMQERPRSHEVRRDNVDRGSRIRIKRDK